MAKGIIDNSDYPEPRVELDGTIELQDAPTTNYVSLHIGSHLSGKLGLRCHSFKQWEEIVHLLRRQLPGKLLRYSAISNFQKKTYHIYVVWRPN